MKKEEKKYKLNEYFSLRCTTLENDYGEKKYSLEVYMHCVPWEERVSYIGNITNSDVANNKFKEIVAKYK